MLLQSQFCGGFVGGDMNRTEAQPCLKWLTMAIATTLLAVAGMAGSSSTATAQPPSDSSTPATATTISSLPYKNEPWGDADNPLATDPAGQLVAASCNHGADIYGTSWWRYTAPSASAFVVHAAENVGGPAHYQPIGVAVVSGDLTSVLACGTDHDDYSDAGLRSVAKGETTYVVTYYTDGEPRLSLPALYLYPSSGTAPANDSASTPRTVEALPFSATQDTTLATADSGPACYSKFGSGPNVWYSVTVDRSQLVDVTIEADYETYYVIAPRGADSPQDSWLCGDRQFRAEAGVSYLIGVYSLGGPYNVGQLSVKLTAAPSAPKVKIKIDSTGKVAKKTGVVSLKGTVTCSGTEGTQPVTGTLRQVYKRAIHEQSFTGSAAACTGKAVRWRATVPPTTFIFKGKTKVTASVTACNTGGCTTDTVKRTVKIKKS